MEHIPTAPATRAGDAKMQVIRNPNKICLVRTFILSPYSIFKFSIRFKLLNISVKPSYTHCKEQKCETQKNSDIDPYIPL